MSNQPIITNATGATQPDQTLHFKDGELFTTLHDRPEQSFGTVTEKAKEIVDGLTPFDIWYATSPERGDYFGFAALHDLCDANMLLPGADDSDPINRFLLAGQPAETVCAFSNAVMEQVNVLLRARPTPPRPVSYETVAAAALGGKYGEDHGPSNDVETYNCGPWEIICANGEREEFEEMEETELAMEDITAAVFSRFLNYLMEEDLLMATEPEAVVAQPATPRVTAALASIERNFPINTGEWLVALCVTRDQIQEARAALAEPALVRAILPEFNIPTEVLSEACKYATLSETSTGGGCDYVTREVSPGRTLVLMAVGDGVSPASLGQPATVTLFLNPSWDEFVNFYFDSTREAIAFMGAPVKTSYFMH